jgi:hypothetical protein
MMGLSVAVPVHQPPVDSMLEDGVCKTVHIGLVLRLRPLQSNVLHNVPPSRHVQRLQLRLWKLWVFRRDRVESHLRHPIQQGTRDLGDLFDEGL